MNSFHHSCLIIYNQNIIDYGFDPIETKPGDSPQSNNFIPFPAP